MFQMPSASSVSKAIKSARKALMTHFVLRYLGFQHMSRDDFIKEHTRSLVQEVLADGEKVAAIFLDGTYLYIEKSSNYSFQRQTYSGHKHRSLIKPMMVVGTDGYILSVLGPYLSDGKNNDASTLKSMMTEMLESLGFRTEIPEYLSKGLKQHTPEEANH